MKKKIDIGQQFFCETSKENSIYIYIYIRILLQIEDLQNEFQIKKVISIKKLISIKKVI